MIMGRRECRVIDGRERARVTCWHCDVSEPGVRSGLMHVQRIREGN